MIDGGAYLAFLKSKFRFGKEAGFAVDRGAINPILRPHQIDMVEWGVRLGRAAYFASFGLGKSFIQLETLRLILLRAGGRGLIVVPLGVRHEFRLDAEKLGIPVTFVRRSDEVGGSGIYLTNYESLRDGKIDPALFTAISLDEASVLRSFGSKTYQTFLTILAGVPYRFVATATPSPNSYKELIHYAGFLGVMDTGQALTRFFQRDSEKANNLTLYLHMEREFWLWLHSWAAFVQKPSDLGHSDEGYDLPPLVVRWHEVKVDEIGGGADRDGQTLMFKDAALGLKQAATEKRTSIQSRVVKMTEIVAASPADHFIIWHDLEAERHAINAAVDCRDVFGTLDLEERERRVIGFANGEFRILSTKPEISGSGCNFQRHCHRAVFLGIGYKFNDFIQAIHRIRRFLQPHQCEIDIIYCETEREIKRDLQRKWSEHDALTAQMAELIQRHGLSTLGIEADLARTIGVKRLEHKSAFYHVAHNDTVLETAAIETDSIDLIVTSIPFGNHYEYSTSYEDFGHNDDNVRFFEQMDFLSPNLLRVLRPGRIAAIHVKDRIRFGNVTGLGMPTVDPFHSDCIVHYKKHGFAYMGMITVVTDVVRENNQTYRLGWSEQCKDGTKMGVGSPEYVLLFRKSPTDLSTAYADIPVVHEKDKYTRGRWQIDAHAFWRSSGERFLTADELAGYGPDRLAKAFPDLTLRTVYDYREHVKLAEALDDANRLPSTFGAVLPGSHDETVWHDVNRMRTLNGKQAQRNLVQHICPLQFDIVDRLIERYSNKEEWIFDPFGGLFTVPYCAIKLGRRGRAVELNADYYRDGLRHLREADREASMPTLFGMERAAPSSPQSPHHER
jgi:DNA modification methylase